MQALKPGDFSKLEDLAEATTTNSFFAINR